MRPALRLTVLVAVGLLLASAWHFWYVPSQVQIRYDRGYQAYAEDRLDDALRHLRQARSLRSGSAETNVLLGWTYWRMDRHEEAETHFRAALDADPTWFEAGEALAMVRMALDRPDLAVESLERAVEARPRDLPTHLLLGEAYRRTGRNADAVRLYRGMLEWSPPSFEAERALLQLFGDPGLDARSSFALPSPSRSSELRLPFRTAGDYLQARDGDRWRSVYVTGVNLGPARPGDWAVSASLDFRTYREWLGQIAATSGNAVRAYTILPPAFYRALAVHNEEAAEPLWLIQEVWLDDAAQDLYDPDTRAAFEREVRNAIDVIHGQGDIGCRPGHYCGVYTADVSPWVMGLALGREVEPSLVLRTNAGSPDRTTYKGRYVSMEEGHPTEAWFAEMLDLAARYETETYNAQRPLTVVNWPPLDPTYQVTEATQEEEIRIRRALGEEVTESVPEFPNDMNSVSLQVTRYRTESTFHAGLFALYHVYQHWPDFLFLEPSYAEARDDIGPNPYLGYLLHLKEFYPDLPLLIGEYGVSTSPIPVHLHPQGWHNGGLTEAEQAELLVRFSRNIRESGMAGGIVFAWLDEWWKQVHDEFTAPFEPRENDPLWLNALDPEEYFGLVGYRPFDPVPLLRGAESDWAEAMTLYAAGTGGTGAEAPGATGGSGEAGATGASRNPEAAEEGVLEAFHATSDYAYVYLRLDLRDGPELDAEGLRFLIALNALPGRAGSTRIPEADVDLPSGASFLLSLEGTDPGHLAVAEGYNPWEAISVPGRSDLERLQARRDMDPALAEEAFEDMLIEANRPRWARDGREFSPILYNRSILPYGTADPDHPDFDSHAAWHFDREARMVEVRIPWGLLLVMDPTDRRVFGGTDGERRPLPTVTRGLAAAAFVVAEGPDGPERIGAFPAPVDGVVATDHVRLFEWEPWDRVRYRPYFKPAYRALQDLWAGWPRFRD